MALKIFISHGGEGTDACVDEALSQLVPRLEQRGYDVFTDVEKLRGGDWWHEVLYEEMYLCDAAIVLLGPQTIAESKWVRLESDVLMGRHMVRSLRTVVPGILGTKDKGDARRRGYGALLGLQAVLRRRGQDPLPKDGGVAQFVDWVTAEFAPVTEPVDDRPFYDWVKRISSFLRTSREQNPDTVSEAFIAVRRGCTAAASTVVPQGSPDGTDVRPSCPARTARCGVAPVADVTAHELGGGNSHAGMADCRRSNPDHGSSCQVRSLACGRSALPSR
ncbi:toll/interleukin-1 receptor domain-containing protein [Streptomyces bobili]|uniref:toll/interleukin-1 receptor domain-containing protein n=1 Tax=Streptomyces bobili TaxID=67280 RepID=UPI0033DE0F65